MKLTIKSNIIIRPIKAIKEALLEIRLSHMGLILKIKSKFYKTQFYR